MWSKSSKDACQECLISPQAHKLDVLPWAEATKMVLARILQRRNGWDLQRCFALWNGHGKAYVHRVQSVRSFD